jgi:hypothetical protein
VGPGTSVRLGLRDHRGIERRRSGRRQPRRSGTGLPDTVAVELYGSCVEVMAEPAPTALTAWHSKWLEHAGSRPLQDKTGRHVWRRPLRPPQVCPRSP